MRAREALSCSLEIPPIVGAMAGSSPAGSGIDANPPEYLSIASISRRRLLVKSWASVERPRPT
ncbi:hypothetical protein D3C83_06430 [compost metagenome]